MRQLSYSNLMNGAISAPLGGENGLQGAGRPKLAHALGLAEQE
jgi:hypothetical protein